MTCKSVLLSVILLFTVSNFAFSQKEGYIWYFGEYAGLDFNTGLPVPLVNSTMNAFEGCASISDSQGDLLFYTDGLEVYTKNHTLMPNGTGLNGHTSASQSGVIVPKPGSSHIYYVFTVPQTGDDLYYSIVDLSLNGGLGEVTSKNNFLISSIDEKITAVLHSNQSDIWVITHGHTTNTFYSTLVTSAGVMPNPMVSNVGSSHSSARGILKASPDGSTLAMTITTWGLSGAFELYDFNSSNGVVSAPFFSDQTVVDAYGIEFSPSGQFVYMSRWYGGGQIYQYDVSSGNQNTIMASKVCVVDITPVGSGVFFGALQAGPDGNIYVAMMNGHSLSIIDNPNQAGNACGYSHMSLYLNGKVSGIGLPNFITSYFGLKGIVYRNACLPDTTFFALSDTTDIDSVYWDFGNPGSWIMNNSTLFEPYHVYTTPGSYNVSVLVWHDNVLDTFYRTIEIADPFILDMGNDTSMCEGGSIQLVAPPGFQYYIWPDNSTDSVYTVTSGGYVTLKVMDENNCPSIDSIKVNAYPIPEIFNEDSISRCEKVEIFLNAGNTFDTYLWSTGSTQQAITVTSNPGYYWVEVANENCVGLDSIYVDYFPCEPIGEIPNIITPNGDGYNDKFAPELEHITNYQLKIYNRWGKLLFTSEEVDHQWDGTVNGNPCIEGTYYFVITFTDPWLKNETLGGTITILR